MHKLCTHCVSCASMGCATTHCMISSAQSPSQNSCNYMQVCTSLQTDNHTSTPPLSFLQAGCPSCRPINSVKALKVKHRPSGVGNGMGRMGKVLGAHECPSSRLKNNFFRYGDLLDCVANVCRGPKNYSYATDCRCASWRCTFRGWVKKVSCCIVTDISKAKQ